MLFEESLPGLIVGVNAAIWLFIHIGSVVLSNLLNSERFNPEGWLFKTRNWEREGRFYSHRLSVKKWKELLPDGARIQKKSFEKKRLSSISPAYLMRFVEETCRAELCHWLIVAAVPLFFLWNTWRIAVFMLPYAIITNLPCIVVQRYNRPRFIHAMRRRTNVG